MTQTFQELTTRQQNLYKLIEYNSLVNGRKTTQREVCDTIAGFNWNDSETAHDHCTPLWSDINAINYCADATLKMIIYKNFECWLASEEEAREYIKEYFEKSIAPRLSRLNNWKKKLKEEGQFDLIIEDFIKRYK